MNDPMPAIESILGFKPEQRTPLAAETHNVLVEIAKQLRIANEIAYYQGIYDSPVARDDIEKGLDL